MMFRGATKKRVKTILWFQFVQKIHKIGMVSKKDIIIYIVNLFAFGEKQWVDLT